MKNRRTPILRVGGLARCFMAAVLFLSEGTSLWSARDIWSERRRAVESTRFASPLPEKSQTVWDQLAASFPTLEDGVSPFIPTSNEELPAWLASTVGLYADVGTFHPPSPGEHRVLIHIQDLHEVEEAQRNISAVLNQLSTGLGGPKGLLVGLEGAAGGFHTAEFRGLVSPALLRRTANRFLKAGLLSGPEYFSLTTDRPLRLWGTEKVDLYESNIRALTGSFSGQEEDDAGMKTVQLHLSRVKAKVYPPALKKMDEVQTRYDEGQVGLTAYATHITDGVPEENIGPNLHLFLKAAALEGDLPFHRVSQDQKRLLEQLAPTLKEADVRRLVEAGLAYRVGRAPYSKFHSTLTTLCRDHGVSLADYPTLNAYALYAEKVEGIDPSALLQELETLSDRQWEFHLTTPALKILAGLAADARVLDQLNRFVLTPEDYKKLLARRDEILAWDERTKELDRLVGERSGPWPALGPLLERHEPFYRLAEERNRPLIHNLVPHWTDDVPAVLVAGGYHAEGIRAAAQAQGLGYISLTPRVLSTQDFPPPLASFRSGDRKREWVFHGEQSGLHDQLMTAVAPAEGTFDRMVRRKLAFVASVVGDQAAEILQGEAPWEERLFRRVQNEIQRTLEAAGRLGLDLAFHEAKPLGLDIQGHQRVLLSFKVQSLAGAPAREGRGTIVSVEVTLPGKAQVAEMKVTMDSPGPIHQWLEGIRVVRGWLTLPQWGPRLWDSFAMAGSQFVFDLGQATRTTAVTLATPLRWVAPFPPLRWLARRADQWIQIVRLKEERAVRDLALNLPPSLRSVMLSRLAEQHLMSPIPTSWKAIVDTSVRHFLTPLGRTHDFLESSLSPQGDVLTLSVRSGGKNVLVRFRVSDSRALIENPGDHSLFQVVQAAESTVFDVTLQMAAVSRAGAISNRVMTRLLREIDFRVNGTDAAIAEQWAQSPLDEMRNRRDLLLYNLGSRLADMDTLAILATDSLVRLTVPREMEEGAFSDGPPERDLSFTSGGAEWNGHNLNRKIGLVPSYYGPVGENDPLENPRVLTAHFLGLGYSREDAIRLAEWTAMDHLKKQVEGLALFARFDSFRRMGRNFFPGLGRSGARVGPLTDVVLDRILFVAGDQGRRAALLVNAESPREEISAVLKKSISGEFFPLAQTLLGILSSSGIQVGAAGDPAVERWVNDLLRVYVAHFTAGFQRMQSLPLTATEMVDRHPGEAEAPAVLVAHLTEQASSANAAGTLLENILERVNRKDPRPFRILALLDYGGGERGDVVDALVSRLETEFADHPGSEAAVAALQNPDAFQVAEARSFRRDGAMMSVEEILRWVRSTWSSSGHVAIFTPNADAFLFDVEQALAWALYENRVLVSRSLDAEMAKRRLQEFIRQNA
jgi:hypothetical protein